MSKGEPYGSPLLGCYGGLMLSLKSLMDGCPLDVIPRICRAYVHEVED
jgi:hypothetical protein